MISPGLFCILTMRIGSVVSMSRQDESRLAATELVQLHHVNKVYANGTIALQDVSMHISENEFISFVGPSGCGKSTVFKLIAGLTDPTDGKLQVMGTTPALARKHSEMAFVFQEHTLLPWCSVEENVMLPLTLRGMSKKWRKEESARVLELVGLQDYKKALPRMLSGGMKMRVSIARALVSRPKLLLMDEPFGALDEITRQTLQQEMLEIWQREKGMTVLFVTHNVFEAVFLSTRVMVMTSRPGKVSREIGIPVTFPRDESFHTTSEFSDYVREVSAALKH